MPDIRPYNFKIRYPAGYWKWLYIWPYRISGATLIRIYFQDEGLSVEEIEEEEVLHEELLDVVDAAQFEQTLQGAEVEINE